MSARRSSAFDARSDGRLQVNGSGDVVGYAGSTNSRFLANKAQMMRAFCKRQPEAVLTFRA